MHYRKPAPVLVPVGWHEETAELLASAAGGLSTARGKANGS
jgi:hypothetical protein